MANLQAARASVSDRFVDKKPHPQNVLDLFDGEWSSAMPSQSGLHVKPGYAALFEDARITWANTILGPFSGKTILELGPLEGGHSYMLHNYGADVIAIEGNAKAFLRCLCVKEIFGLSRVSFMLGNFMKFLEVDSRRFDVIIASGVLYHMTEPLQLLRKLVARANRIFVWTHYFDATAISQRNDAHLFQGTLMPLEKGASYYGIKKLYPQQALDWSGFSGGQEMSAVWMDKDSICRFFTDSGFEINMNFVHPHHPNGPSFALCASRRS